jgi:multicomponent Na+:H+ antiporter subunit B
LNKLALFAVLLTGSLLLYGTRDFPAWGDPQAPASQHLSSTYIEKAIEQTHVPNIVTAVLGDYRGYDTMFETVVIYCAGIVVVGVLRNWREEE